LIIRKKVLLFNNSSMSFQKYQGPIMKKEKGCLGRKIGVFLLMLPFAFLPIHSSLLLAAEAPFSGPSTERENGSHGKDATPSSDQTSSEPSTERETGERGGDAGPGATKDLKINKWWWIGGGLVAVAAIAAAAGGGGGGGGGGSTPSH
jgi:hypothetical protein